MQLNKDLEITETELQALRNEPERIGMRIQKIACYARKKNNKCNMR